MSGLASQIRFSRLGQARGASPGSLDQRSEEWPLCEGKSGAHGVRLRPAPSEGGRELWGPHGRLSSALPRGGGEQGGGGIGAVQSKGFEVVESECASNSPEGYEILRAI